MDEYRLRLRQINRELSSNPLDRTNLGVLNSINYMIYILNEWKNSQFFIQMQFIDMRFKQFQNQYKIVDESIDNDDVDQLNESRVKTPEFEFDFRRISKKESEMFDEQMTVNLILLINTKENSQC